MNNHKSNALCTDPEWKGRADCRRCPIREQVLFAEVPDSALDNILVPIDNLRYAEKSVIYRLNDPGRAIFTIRRGAVKLMHTLSNGTVRVVRVLTSGDVFGMEALLDRAYTHTAMALHAVDICRIPSEIVHKLNASLNPLHDELHLRWQRNLEQADAFITQLTSGTAQTRMARLLLLLDGHAGVDQGTSLHREEMGQILGVATETAARIIADFKRRGIVREVEATLYYTDIATLQQIALDE